MAGNISYYTDPGAMSPLFPDDPTGKLEAMATELIEKSAKLSGVMNPITRAAIADFLRPMNSYYSNLIEGHDTHPIDINRALKNDFSENKKKRDLQLEAHAHIQLHKTISETFRQANHSVIPSSVAFIKDTHKQFYNHLPDDFRFVKSEEGEMKEVVPGEFRTSEVKVGRHIGPFSESVRVFANRFEEFYDPIASSNKSKIKRVISIAASHHRLAWIHPFLDGNGRVVRLYSDACFMYENLHSSGLWSVSRGLARTNQEYNERLANADSQRYNDYDGRGNLSNRFLIEFCEYFLKTAIDQIDYMYQVIDVENMLHRIERFTDLMALKGKMKPEAKYVLGDLFLKGRISKADAMRITNTSDKTLKKLTDSLAEMELLEARKESISTWYYVKYPINFSPYLFPGLYPADKEIGMMEQF